MSDDERISAVRELLLNYVRSPSLRHVRDPHSVGRLAQDIVKRIDGGNSIWRKWDGQREVLLKFAVACWIPIEDMREFLNWMPGPRLTTTGVAPLHFVHAAGDPARNDTMTEFTFRTGGFAYHTDRQLGFAEGASVSNSFRMAPLSVLALLPLRRDLV